METHIRLAYLAASILFIFGIKGLTAIKTARRGNQISALGMLVAVLATLAFAGDVSWKILLAGVVVGGGIGAFLSVRVPLTGMPELVAAFNGFGGLASVCVALAQLNKLLGVGDGSLIERSPSAAQAVILPVTILIGTITFTGSLVAYFKLGGKKLVHPLPGALRHIAHLALLGAVVWGGYQMAAVADGADAFHHAALIVTGAAAVLGVLLVLPIGGADMPVVVSLLNSYSGLAAAATGFLLKNEALVVSGALVGASGLILTRIMCVAMNRSLGNVLLGGIGDDSVAEDARDYDNVKSTSGEELAMLLDAASDVIIVPGYGLAVSQAHHVVREIGDLLLEKGIHVRYGIHPVAGRMPGHMNVLLAEANVPYDQLKTMEEIDGDFRQCDLALVIGANDIVNPVADTDPASPIAGMPILHVDQAQTVVMVKRSLSPGYAGIKNPLFEADNCLMLFGDGKEAMTATLTELKEG